MRSFVGLGVALLAVACKSEGDHCEIGATKCEDNAVLVCQQNNTKADLLRPHDSPYWDRTECLNGKQCVRTEDGIGAIDCVESVKPCDPAARPDVTERGDTVTVRACSKTVGKSTYLETRNFKRCDPANPPPRCTCGKPETLTDEPAIVRDALRRATFPTLCRD